ncbi:MAG: hypothetical protein JO130_09240, partial [Solirubrobacterales bacterium]|nr:hypothetical protein [Solirubrobacterales bacterium]
SLEGFEAFLSTRLGELPAVDKLDSHITMKLIKAPEHQIEPRSTGLRSVPHGS